MDARRSLDRVSRSLRGVRPWTLTVLGLLLMAGTMLQACSDNNGNTGPVFECREQKGGVKVLAQCTAGPAPVTGDGIGGPGGTVFVQVTVNPGTIDRGRRATVLTIVSNLNGFPLPGRRVFLAPSVGRLDATSGVTNSAGLFSTSLFIPCEVAPDTAVTISAVVDGVTATADLTVAPGQTSTSVANDPCPPLPVPQPEPEPVA
jgi:hypothetical protein